MAISQAHIDKRQSNTGRSNADEVRSNGVKRHAVPALQKKEQAIAIAAPTLSDVKAAGDTIQKYSAAYAMPSASPVSGTDHQETIQRYSSNTFTIDGKKVKGTLSETGQYFLPNGAGTIYATSPPRACAEIGAGLYNFNGLSYRLYQPGQQFLDDCLHTAEEIVNGKILEYGKGTYTRETTTNYVFGQSDQRNIEIAETAKLYSVGSINESAAPGIGNAFVIVDTEFETKPSKRSPYHAAGVIGVDGNDRITMEVFAHGGSLVNRETDSSLGIYTVGGGSRSFHGYWSTNYFKNYSTITIVIKAK